MLKFNLSLKLVIGYSLMAVLLIICGLAGYIAANKLSDVSDFLVNEARFTVQGALQTSNGVREQIQVMEDILSGRITQNIDTALNSAKNNTNQAYQKMIDAGLLPDDQLTKLNAAQQAFIDALNPLMEGNKHYQNGYYLMISNADDLKNLLNSINNLANRIIVERETNWDTDDAANSEQTEEWFAATATTEAKLGLFSQLYYYQRFISSTNRQPIEELMVNSRNDLDIYIEDLSSMKIAEKTPKDSTETYAASLKYLQNQHKILYDQAKASFLNLQQKRLLYTSKASALLEQTVAIEKISDQVINQEINKIQQVKKSAFLSILITVLVGIVLVVVAYWVALKIVVCPVRNVAEKLDDISQGDGDLTQTLSIKGNDEITDLSRGFNNFTQQIRSLIVELVEATGKLSSTSSDLANQSVETQNQMSAQQDVTNSVSNAMDEMSNKVESVSLAAEEAEQSMKVMDQTLEKSQHVISSTLNSINEFAADIDSANTVIEELNRDSQQIGSVLDVIQGIAEQTNLLALNAAIEAARAGEQGRGFAVVADEVRTLASRTQDSTTEIKAIIDRLQNGSSKAASVMGKSQKDAQDTVSKTASASESLSSITSNIQSMGHIINNISSAATTQNQQAQSMNQNLSNIRQITAETTQSNQNMSEITVELNQLANQLKSLVGHFKI
ncbi:MAG: HAMP domain-containing protein [Gammaproteobacteria bacterium]|jgi:methyl-accepting chemotaxis protein|nr:HAMP domain-containing protein [Gammaproteobacteria bacterium]MBT7044672.1 HAMP domain-containing protein [Gammaproteobacteria bacterium]